MAKSKKTGNKKIRVEGSVIVKGNVIGSNILAGDNNVLNVSVESIKTVGTLFTIPAPVTDFTGREAELKKLKDSFAGGAIITGVSGGGGVGKTELARRLAQELAGDYPDARMELNLQGTLDTALSPDEAMRRLLEPLYPNQKLPEDEAQLKGLYQQTFRERKALLLLDNAASADQIRPLIPIPPSRSAAIITARQRFTLNEFGLKEPLRLDVLKIEEARELLKSASDGLKKTPDETLDELAEICGRLPLALRVAASILNDSPNWTADTLIQRLRDERTRLERLKRDRDQHLDVEASLSLSYELLDENLKKYFRLASVFTAPFHDFSAKAVWSMDDEDDLAGVLMKLVNRSLLNFLPAQEGRGGLYDLHDLTRLFGTTRLLENPKEAKEAIEKHAGHFLQLAAAADDEYKKGGEHILIGLNQFRFIWPHLLAAYESLLPEQKYFPRPDSANAWLSNFPRRCVYVMDLLLPPRQKIPILQNALEAARRLRDRRAEGVHLGNLGLAYADLGETRKAIEFYEQHMQIAREIGDRRGEGNALDNLGLAYADLGEKGKAIEFTEQALAIFDAIESPYAKQAREQLSRLRGQKMDTQDS